MKIAEVIQKIEEKHVKLDTRQRSCDGVVYGGTERECTGIVLTCCPTVRMIKEAVRLGYNMILCHEPAFYHGWDETDRIQETWICQEKKRLLDQNGILIYRDHDHVHQEKPDMVFSGIIQKLGWEKYRTSNEFFPTSKYVIPETTLEELGQYVADKMKIDGIRIIGEPAMKVRNVGLMAHFFGGPEDQELIREIERNDYDVIIPGEIVDWTIGEYIQDSNALGRKRGMLNVGHFNLEEPGMEMMEGWLKDAVADQVPVSFVRSGNAYSWLDCRR
nr:Nif3-like dinuclear metal center hexameric protein [uncultured Blautia sp.]